MSQENNGFLNNGVLISRSTEEDKNMRIQFSGHSTSPTQKSKLGSSDNAPKLQFGQSSDAFTQSHSLRPSRFKMDAHGGCDQYDDPKHHRS
jgi:hypothetical protein